MEERISGYRLRYGKVPDWGKEYLEKKEIQDNLENKDVMKSSKKKSQKLKINMKKFDDEDDYDIAHVSHFEINTKGRQAPNSCKD